MHRKNIWPDKVKEEGKNQKVSLDVVERICKRLQCKVEEVIVYDEDFE